MKHTNANLLIVISAVFITTVLLTGTINLPSDDNNGSAVANRAQLSSAVEMILINGGSFLMGDVFGEGKDNELPVHSVTLDDFHLAKFEVTVAEYRTFVEETGYKTSAEGPVNPEAQQKIIQTLRNRTKEKPLSKEEFQKVSQEYISYSGTYCWKTNTPGFEFRHDINWHNPDFDQTDNDPVICLSWDDAAHYCNWLSKKESLPVAYDLETREFLDAEGRPTEDVTEVKGYRLPTEAEWEYAAREGGKKVRFGNGKDVASSKEINFRADSGDYPYFEKGEYRRKTVPVGSFSPNSLGLYDMSGNAWEWCSDSYGAYVEESQANPCNLTGLYKVIRSGRWGGDANEIRVFSRYLFLANDRCNNSGFRIARSK